MNTLTRIFPWAITSVFALYALLAVGRSMAPQETYNDFNLTAFGSIPVLDSGRIKPLDSVARTHMLYISGQSEFDDPNGKKRPAILWLLELMVADDPSKGMAADAPIFKVDNENLKNLLELPNRPGLRYSWNEITKPERFSKFLPALKAARNMDDKKRDLDNAKIIELGNRLQLYLALANHQSPTLISPEPGTTEWQSLGELDERLKPFVTPVAEQRARLEAIRLFQGKNRDPNSITNTEFSNQVATLLPSFLRAEIEKARKEFSPAAGAFGDILTAYKEKKPKAFAAAIEEYKSKYVYPLNPELRDTTKFELGFNYLAPFILAAVLYVLAGSMTALGWLGWTRPLRKGALGIVAVALLLNFYGLVGRMYIMGRPLVFVTNLYSSALFIGFGAVACCYMVELIFRNGIGLVVGTIIGASAAKIAHHLSTDGNDTMGSLVAVLDTNYWLASHVTTITLGYSATYAAGLLGLTYIIWGLFFTTLDRPRQQTLGRMTYGMVCFALFLSFVGTVLGGIWADQSWGRFWGWDPKENGAVLIVIWNSLILHARGGGIVKQRGVAVLTVVGVMVTTWSWFGTNQLGVGLHNYGFNKTLADGCMYTWIACLVVIGLGLIPLPYWRSYPALTAPVVALPLSAAPTAAPGASVPSAQQPVLQQQTQQQSRQGSPGQQSHSGGKKPSKR